MSVAQQNKSANVSAEVVDAPKAHVREFETLLKLSELR